MSRKQGHERAHGPFAHGNRWRVVIVGADGARAYAKESDDGPSSFASYETAQAYVHAFRASAGDRSIVEAVTAFIEATSTGKQTTDDKARFALTGFLRTADGDKPLTTLTTLMAAKLVKARQSEVAYETARIELGYATRFVRWCIGQGWLRVNPFVESTLEKGERSRGKPQLRVDEARKFIAHVTADPSIEATATLIAILMGLRAHEVVERTVRDIDDDGRLLVIGKSKTKAGERTVVVPAALRPRLMALAAGKASDALLFDKPTDPRRAASCTRHWLHYHVTRFAKEAGVPRVTPHGLRGSWATFAITAQLPGVSPGTPMTIDAAAKAIGHNDAGATMRRHYLAPGAEESAATNRVESLLGPTGEQPDSNWN